MTKEDIIKPENLVYQKPRLLNDNPMLNCFSSINLFHKLLYIKSFLWNLPILIFLFFVMAFHKLIKLFHKCLMLNLLRK